MGILTLRDVYHEPVSVTNTIACGGTRQFASFPLPLTGKSKTASRLFSSSGFPSNLSFVITIPLA